MHAVMQVSCLDHSQQKRHRLQLTLNLKSLSCTSVAHTNPLLLLTTYPELTDVKHFSKFTSNVRELSLFGFFLNSRLLEAIAQIRGLEVLDLADSYLKVTDHLHLLFCLKRLRTLRLPRCGDKQIVVGVDRQHQTSSLIITDFVHGIGFSMPNYRWLTHLTRLCVHEAHIASAAFASLPMLKQLKLQNCVWDEDPQAVIPHLRGLEGLDVRSEDPFQFLKFTKSASQQIGLLLTELRDLSLVQNDITDAGLRHLAGLRLRRLELCANMLKPGDEKILATFTELRTLRVNNDNSDGMNKKISRIVSSATQLHTLIVDSFMISDSFFDHIAKLSELRALQLHAASGVNDANLAKLTRLRCLVSVDVEPFQIGFATNTNDVAVVSYTNDAVKYLHTAGICLSPRGQQVDGFMGQAQRVLGMLGLFWLTLSHAKHYDRYASRYLWLLDVVRACLVNIVSFLWQLWFVLAVVSTVWVYFGGEKWWFTLF